MPIKAVILIGGPSKGTRFRPLSLDVPKPLFPIAGFPILYHHIKACVSKLAPELKEIVLLGFYDPSKLQSFIISASREFSVPIKYHVESTGLGTGGGLYHFKNEILTGLDDDSSYIFVLHCDVFCSFPLREILEFHKKHQKECTILGKIVPSSETVNYGCLVEDPQTHEVLHYVEKPDYFISNLASCGLYLFSKSLFDLLDEFARSALLQSSNNVASDDEAYFFVEHNVLPNGDIKIELERNILVPLSQRRGLYVYETKDWWIPIKHVGVALECAEQLLKQYRKTSPELLAQSKVEGPTIVGDVLIDPTAQIHPTAKIGPNVTIGKGVTIGAGARVRQAIILDHVEIKEHACVLWSILGWGSVIGQWSRIEGEPQQNSGHDVRTCGLSIFGNDVVTAREVSIRKCIVLPHKTLNESADNQTIL